MKNEKGNFVYDESGKVIWQPSEDGNWTMAIEFNRPDINKYQSIGIDPYEQVSVSERLELAKKLQSLGNTGLDKRIYKQKKK